MCHGVKDDMNVGGCKREKTTAAIYTYTQERLGVVDLRHMDEQIGSNIVDVGVDLSEFYMSVEWDILEVPAVRAFVISSLITNCHSGFLLCTTPNQSIVNPYWLPCKFTLKPS
ncbi:hypothetical protein PV328_006153 [Microctonus aethiopoides]|uniref:Uncharacterized protein n=1 Tax=Microctonus aethiopoides TaxID=144406 RepID=A0AA39KT89_9HYME|nr:hypothetical protein PV328_006153 [Microctonus aethiopoides]